MASNRIVDPSDDYYVGASVGYEWKGLYGLASYVVTGEQDMESGGVKYSKGRGPQLAIGYRFLIDNDIYIGPELTFRAMKYRNKEIQGIPQQSDRTDTTIYPGIIVLFKF